MAYSIFLFPQLWCMLINPLSTQPSTSGYSLSTTVWQLLKKKKLDRIFCYQSWKCLGKATSLWISGWCRICNIFKEADQKWKEMKKLLLFTNYLFYLLCLLFKSIDFNKFCCFHAFEIVGINVWNVSYIFTLLLNLFVFQEF